MKIPDAVIAETDARAFELRKAGLTYRQIARALDVGEARAYNGVQRVLRRIGTKLAEDNIGVVQMELDRLDTLMSNLWPMTMPHDSPTEDGSTVRLPPSFDAVDRVLKIMDRRAKLLGLDQVTLNIQQQQGDLALGRKAPELAEISPKEEALRLLAVMEQAGVIDPALLVQAKKAAAIDAAVRELEPGTDASEVVVESDDGEPFFGDVDGDDELDETA